MVILKKIEHMEYFSSSKEYTNLDGNKVDKEFPNYYIFNNVAVSNKQKNSFTLHAQPGSRSIDHDRPLLQTRKIVLYIPRKQAAN